MFVINQPSVKFELTILLPYVLLKWTHPTIEHHDNVMYKTTTGSHSKRHNTKCIVREKMVSSQEKCILIIESYFSTRSVVSVQEYFNKSSRDKPNKTSVLKLVTKFREIGSVNNEEHNRSITVLNADTIAEIEDQLTPLTEKSI